MKCSEFRCGNIIFSKSQNHFQRINLYILDQIAKGSLEYEYAKLNLDWFDDFGFEKSWHGWGRETQYTFEKDGDKFQLLIDGVHADVWIKYVHELQNLYYILSGIELEPNKMLRKV